MLKRLERTPVAGLLVVCVLLAAALLVTAVLSYRAARTAARSVLHSRAVEVANSLAAVARLLPPEPEELEQLVQEHASDRIGVAVCQLDGRVLAAAGGPAPLKAGADVEARTWSRLRDLRARGQVHRVRKGQAGEYLEYWQPMRGPRRRGPRGRRPRGRGPDWRRGPGDPLPPGRAGALGPGDAAWQRQGRQGEAWQQGRQGPDTPWWRPGKRGPGPRRPRRLKLVRVTVAASVADDLIQPARGMLVLAGGAAGLLLVLGVVMYRAAGRARAAQRELQRRRALSALGEMGAVLAHEIRTPLASIKGNAQLVGEERPDDARMVAMVQEAGRLERLVDGLLDYARPTQPQRVLTDPDGLAERAAQIVAPRARQAGVSLLTDPAGCGACLWADPDQVLQVLVNLLQNSVEACSEGDRQGPHSVALQVRRRRGQVLLTVLDSGPGLDEASVDRLMQPFHSTRHQGTGLGLSVARQIVLQHGGQLRLENRKQGGARAVVVLPEKAQDPQE